MIHALVTQMLNALEHHQSQTRQIHKTEFAITAAREYLATEPKQLGTITFGGCPACGKQSCIARSCMTTEPIGERAELIARLAKQWAELDPADPYRADVGQAVSMLEADGKQKETKNEQQVRSGVDAMGGRQPMEVSGDCSRDNFNGDDRALVASMVALLKLDAAGCLVPHGIGGYAQKLLQASITRLEADARQTNKPTGWDNGLSQDYCAEFGQWLASRPGARQQIKAMFDTSTPLQP